MKRLNPAHRKTQVIRIKARRDYQNKTGSEQHMWEVTKEEETGSTEVKIFGVSPFLLDRLQFEQKCYGPKFERL